jgi:biopolymer transport protein ExbB
MINILKALALSGGNWVIDALLICSVVAVAAIIERGILLLREERAFLSLRKSLIEGSWEKNNLTKFEGASSRILAVSLSGKEVDASLGGEIFAAQSWAEKRFLEKRLLILGTLGSNAPFIGLLGTVLGVIKAFHDLAQSGAGPEIVMKGLSEALITTAVGLFVAIPCVISYNYFQKKVQDILSGTESLIVLIRARSADKSAS